MSEKPKKPENPQDEEREVLPFDEALKRVWKAKPKPVKKKSPKK